METITGAVPVVPKSKANVPAPRRQVSADATPLPQSQKAGGVSEQQLAQAEAKRIERLRQAASTFVLGPPKSFTIYKDAAGQLITRFTNLSDGKVTYIPEPNLLGRLESRQGAAPSLSFRI